MAMKMGWMALAFVLVMPMAAGAESYVGQLKDASSAADALMSAKAHDWRQAHSVVKDRFGDMVFERINFPLKGEMTPDDMIACIDDLAYKGDPARPVQTMVAECGGARGYQVD